MRKVYLKIMCMVIVNVDEGIEISDIVDELDYNFVSTTDGADIVDTEILDYDIVDSK
jgi:hypothetical protein